MTRITKAQIASEEKQQAIDYLKTFLKPGSEVYTQVLHVSSSGMTREIKLLAVVDGQIRNISYKAAKVMQDKIGNHDGIKISGCGMDMGFSLVYNLGRALFPDGFALPASKHGRNGNTSGHDTDGGYALTQRWI
jgi:hypothetical protein